MLKGHKLFKKNLEVKVEDNTATTEEVHEEAPTISAEEVLSTKAAPKSFKTSKAPATIYAIIVLLMGAYVVKDQFYTDKSVYNDYPPTYYEEERISKIDTTKDYIYFENKKKIASITSGDMYEKDIDCCALF